MKVARSLFPSITLGLALLSFLVLGTPTLGSAQNYPHPCTLNASWNPTGHLPQSLGGVTTFNFTFAKNCPPYTSSPDQWQFQIYQYGASTPLPGCSWGPFTLPPDVQPPLSTSPPLTCNSLPKGPYPKIKVALGYLPHGSQVWMWHTDLFGN